MNLDEAVRVSAVHLDGFSSAHHGRDCVMCVAARAVLAMAPVVEAARAIDDRCWCEKCLDVDSEDMPSDLELALHDALSTLSSKVPHGE